MHQVEPIPEIRAVEQAIIERFRFDRTELHSMFPGCARSWYRSFEQTNRKGEAWPRLVVYKTYLDLVGYEWRVTITWYDTTGTYNWHEQGSILPSDRDELLKIAESVPGLVKAYREDAAARKDWPWRGTRRIPGIGTHKPRPISTDQLETPRKRGKKEPPMSRIELKYAWMEKRATNTEQEEGPAE